MTKGNSIDKKYYSLLELTKSVESVIKKTYSKSYWVKAEIAKLNYYPKSGHCYPDLVEKEKGVVLAQMRGTIWSGQFSEINRKFIVVAKEPLSDGMTVLLRANITFHGVYGMSLQILDIEPSFTLGELAKEKQQSIDRLIQEGLFHSNKQLVRPLLIQRLAVISVETSKGYHDFIKVIEGNSWGYKFFHMLFPALLQGAGAISSISEQLKRVKKVLNHFDAVLIIRGGGGDVGLSSFDNYNLAKAVAEFPLPVIAGIGHATNETVVEQVSYVNKITPTEVGYYLIQQFHNYSVRIEEAQNAVLDLSKQIVQVENNRIEKMVSGFKMATDSLLFENREKLGYIYNRLSNTSLGVVLSEHRKVDQSGLDLSRSIAGVIKDEGNRISSIEDRVRLLDPKEILKRGYSLTLHKGKAILSIQNIEPGDEIETLTHDAVILSEVTNVKKNKEK